jgi:thioredoxin 1
MKKILLVALAASTLTLAWCSWNKTTNEDAMMKKDDAMVKDEAMMKKDDAMMKDEAMMKKDDAMMKDEAMMKKDDAMMMKKEPSSYQNYSESAVASALKDGKKVALFFHAARCPGCKGLDKDITAGLSTLPENSIVFKVDYDTSTDLKKKYGVTTQHTVVALNTDMSAASKTIWTTLDGVKKQLQ